MTEGACRAAWIALLGLASGCGAASAPVVPAAEADRPGPASVAEDAAVADAGPGPEIAEEAPPSPPERAPAPCSPEWKAEVAAGPAAPKVAFPQRLEARDLEALRNRLLAAARACHRRELPARPSFAARAELGLEVDGFGCVSVSAEIRSVAGGEDPAGVAVICRRIEACIAGAAAGLRTLAPEDPPVRARFQIRLVPE